MKFAVMNVTQQQAREWLRKNAMNRPLRKGYVKNIAEAMKRGEWTVTHQPIAINGGRLLDGQHRLAAFLESGLPALKMTVAQECESATFDAIDIGVKRTNADIYREDPHVMHALSLIGYIAHARQITPRELQPVYQKFHKPIKEIISALPRSTNKFSAAPIRVAALAAIINGEDQEYVLNVYKNMCAFKAERLPRVAQIFLKQLTLEVGGNTKIASTNRWQLLVRAWIVFQKANADLERVMVKDATVRLAEIRDLFRKEMGIKSN